MKKNYVFLVLISLIFTSNLILSQTTETENFDSYGTSDDQISNGDETAGGFWNGGAGDFPWEVEAEGDTDGNSSGTGPSDAYNGTGFIYIEGSID